MDYKTKEYYRNKVKELAKKTKISEIYIAKKIIELANEYKDDEKKGHIGYYLISNGICKLYKSVGIKSSNIQSKTEEKVKLYIYCKCLLSILLSIGTGLLFYVFSKNIVLSIVEAILIYIPMSEIVVNIIQNILGKTVKPTLIPKMDFSKGVSKENVAMIVIPTIIQSRRKSKRACRKARSFLSCK